MARTEKQAKYLAAREARERAEAAQPHVRLHTLSLTSGNNFVHEALREACSAWVKEHLAEMVEDGLRRLREREARLADDAQEEVARLLAEMATSAVGAKAEAKS